ncbi:MAG TPA: VWA domain-containing protein, partial [Chloroflexia bacterium]|nr:VWA domain-containing protein [Chloroflexia bacterium]
REARRGRRPLLARRAWSPESVLLNQDGFLDLAAPDRGSRDEPPSPSSFSPPEHRAGAPLDERSDVYLIGAFMYFLAAGLTPPAGIPLVAPEVLPPPAPGKDRDKRPPPRLVAEFPEAPKVNPYLAAALATALQPDPAARYKDLSALEAVLTQLANELHREAQSRGRETGTASFLGRIIGGSAIALIAMLGALSLVSRQNPNLAVVATPAPRFYGIPGGTPGAAGVDPGTEPPSPTPGPRLGPTPAIFSEGGKENINHVAINQVDTRQAPQIVIYFSIIGNDDKPIGGLGKDDVLVTSDGARVTDFEIVNLSTTNATMASLLVMDTSGSMDGLPVTEAKAAAKQFVGIFAPDDKIGVISFNDTAKLRQDVTVSKPAVLASLDALEAFGNTALYDALDMAVNRAAQEPGRSAIILLSDGKDTASAQYTRDDVVQLCKLHSIPVHIVGLNDSADYDGPTLQYLADHTGGELLESPDPAQLTDLYKHLAYQLAGQYRVTLSGPVASKEHEVKITTRSGDKVFEDTSTYAIK